MTNQPDKPLDLRPIEALANGIIPVCEIHVGIVSNHLQSLITEVKRLRAELQIADQALEGIQPALDLYYLSLFQKEMRLRKESEKALAEAKAERDEIAAKVWDMAYSIYMSDAGGSGLVAEAFKHEAAAFRGKGQEKS